MKRRFCMLENGQRFASIHAMTPEQAIHIARRMTGRDPDSCHIEYSARPPLSRITPNPTTRVFQIDLSDDYLPVLNPVRHRDGVAAPGHLAHLGGVEVQAATRAR